MRVLRSRDRRVDRVFMIRYGPIIVAVVSDKRIARRRCAAMAEAFPKLEYFVTEWLINGPSMGNWNPS